MSATVIDYVSAIDAMFSIAQAAIARVSDNIVHIAETRWPGVAEKNPPNENVYWIRVSEQVVLSGQASLSSSVGKAGSKRYETTGLLFIQIFCPKSDPTAVPNGRLIQTALVNAFRAPSGDSNLWFRNQMPKPMSFNPTSYQFNVAVTYQYGEIV
jgi:hypothetical protein